MSPQLELIARFDEKIVYRAEDVGMITPEFIRTLQWPENVRIVAFLFKNPIENEWGVLSVLPHSPDVGIIYSATKQSLLPTGACPKISLVEKSIKSAEELGRLYLECRSRVFANAPEKLSTMVDEKSILPKMQNQINSARIGCWEINSKMAGVVVVTGLHNYSDVLVDWIPWVLIDANLTAEERLALHFRIREWLSVNINKKLQCAVNSFNPRSQKFFRKMGFTPECVRIIK